MWSYPVKVLVDYDNIPDVVRARGLPHVIDRIVDSLVPHAGAVSGLDIRLYGGWFQEQILSRRAQDLAPQLHATFPATRELSHNGHKRTAIVRVELALALAASPRAHLTHTYRPRALPSGVRCEALPFRGCALPSGCAIA